MTDELSFADTCSTPEVHLTRRKLSRH